MKRECKICDLCGSKVGVKSCKEPFEFSDKKIKCICVDCIKRIDAYFNDFVLVYNGLDCFITKKGKKLLKTLF